MDDLEEIMVRCNLQGLNWDKLRILYPNLRNAIFPKFEIQPSNQTNFFFVKLDSQNAQFLLQKRVDSFTIPPYNEYRAIAFKEGRRNTSAVIYGPKCIETDINDLQNGNVEVHESYEFDDDGKQMILYAVKYRTREAGEISWDIIQGNIGQLRNKNILGCNENEDKYDPYKIFIRNIMSDSIKLRIQFLWIDSEILCNEIWFKFDLRQLRNKGTIFNEIFNEITIIDDLKRIGRESGIPNYNQNRDLALLAECEVLKRVVRVQLQFDSYGNLFNSGVITLENTLLAEVYVSLLFQLCNKPVDIWTCGVTLHCYQKYRSNSNVGRWDPRKKCGIQQFIPIYIEQQKNELQRIIFNNRNQQLQFEKQLNPNANEFVSNLSVFQPNNSLIRLNENQRQNQELIQIDKQNQEEIKQEFNHQDKIEQKQLEDDDYLNDQQLNNQELEQQSYLLQQQQQNLNEQILSIHSEVSSGLNSSNSSLPLRSSIPTYTEKTFTHILYSNNLSENVSSQIIQSGYNSINESETITSDAVYNRPQSKTDEISLSGKIKNLNIKIIHKRSQSLSSNLYSLSSYSTIESQSESQSDSVFSNYSAQFSENNTTDSISNKSHSNLIHKFSNPDLCLISPLLSISDNTKANLLSNSSIISQPISSSSQNSQQLISDQKTNENQSLNQETPSFSSESINSPQFQSIFTSSIFKFRKTYLPQLISDLYSQTSPLQQNQQNSNLQQVQSCDSKETLSTGLLNHNQQNSRMHYIPKIKQNIFNNPFNKQNSKPKQKTNNTLPDLKPIIEQKFNNQLQTQNIQSIVYNHNNSSPIEQQNILLLQQNDNQGNINKTQFSKINEQQQQHPATLEELIFIDNHFTPDIRDIAQFHSKSAPLNQKQSQINNKLDINIEQQVDIENDQEQDEEQEQDTNEQKVGGN